MTEYPCTNITVHENILVTVHGPYISTFDLSSGTLLQSTAPSISPSRQTLPADSFILNVAVTLSARRLVSVDQQKSLKVWDLDTLFILSSRELPKKANQALLTDDGQTILVADKFGDVFSYPVVAPVIPRAEPKSKHKANTLEGRKSLASHSNPSLGTLILGHTSSLTTMLLTPEDQFLITADRDEHIRVSQYPRGYNIERFCMGHTKYVSALHLPHHLPGTLISAGGDRHLFLWDYLSGDIKGQLDIRDVVYASTKVSSQRRKFKRLETKAGTGWRARKRREREAKETEEKQRREEKKNEQGPPSGPPNAANRDEDEDMVDATGGSDSPRKAPQPSGPAMPQEESDQMATEDTTQTHLPGGMVVGAARARLPALEDVIVISHITTVQFESQHALIFSAVGANAIFFASCNATTGWGPGDQVHQYKLPYPVLSFDVESAAPTVDNPLHHNRIWVALDHTFVEHSTESREQSEQREQSGTSLMESGAEAGEGTTTSSNSIYLLEWRGGDTMIEVTADSAPLLRTLRSVKSLPASRADIQTLDLYGLLTSLPKTEELEEPDHAGHDQTDFAMETSNRSSLARADESVQQMSVKGIGSAVTEGIQSRQVKKSGRKKWQDKMESRQLARSHDGVVGSTSKTTPSNDRSAGSRTEEVGEMEARNDEHVKALMSGPSSSSNGAVGKARKALDREDADSSEGPATKKIRTDDPSSIRAPLPAAGTVR